MKKLKFIYNPFSGDATLKDNIDSCIHAFQLGGYGVSIFRSMEQGDISAHIKNMRNESYDALVISGGDGSVNIAVNSMIKNHIDIPLGIIPAGTANDFARYLKIPADHAEAAMAIASGKAELVDVGMVNDRYFINVCAAGMLSNISQNIDAGFKNSFGKFAYYIKGIEQLPNFLPIKLKITNSYKTIVEDIYFFCVLNSSGTGGFEKMSPGASITDGLFDFIAFKAIPIHEIAFLFVKALAGDYLSDNNIIFFRDSVIRAEPADLDEYSEMHIPPMLQTDIDGEAGPDMPIEIKNLSKSFKLIIPT